MHARTYSPVLGRFLQPDPARAEGSLYAYAENSPVSKSDPSGLWIRMLARLTVVRTHWGGRNYSFNFRWTQSRPTNVTSVRVFLDRTVFEWFFVRVFGWTGISAFGIRRGAETTFFTGNSGLFRAQCGQNYRYWYTVSTDPNTLIVGMGGEVGLGFAWGPVGDVFRFC